MSDDTENHTIKLLQEMRQEMRERFDQVDEQFRDVNARIDGITHIMTLMAGHSHNLDERVERIEATLPVD